MKAILTTTINQVTEAISKFDAMKDWTLIVAGDKKTPKDYQLRRGIYLSPEDQEKLNPRLSELIGWNNHGRRNFANLMALKLGAKVVAIVDDDNIPMENWGKDLQVGKDVDSNYYLTDLPAFDPIGATNYGQLWHRGFPIQLLSERDYSQCIKKTLTVDIQADFWDGDPDIDAFCRMQFKPCCTFDTQCFPIASNKISPFNSQNVFLSRECLLKYFVLPHVSPHGRMSDIWISFHMQHLGFQVVFFPPSVTQVRNEHDLTVDLVDEYVGYERNIEIVRSIEDGSYTIQKFWPKKTVQCYQEYLEAAIGFED